MVTYYGICLIFLFQTVNHAVYSLSKAPITISTSGSPAAFSSITARQIGILDGSELLALNNFVKQNEKKDKSKKVSVPSFANEEKFGVIKFVTGTAEVEGKNRRVIGLESSESTSSKKGDHALTLATIPDGISDLDAISTAMASLVGVHCCLPTIDKIGKNNDDAENTFIGGKTVVLGGGELACFAASALDELGIDVTLVSTRKPRIKNSKVTIMPPLIGEKELGFSEVIGEFDSMLDTLYDENNVGDEGLLSGSGIVQELHKAHKCQRYVSSCNNAQKIIRESGVFFGPNEVKDYEKKIAEKATAATKTSSKLQEVTIPSNFGTMTLQKLLDGKIIFPAKSKNLQPITRGWTLKDFWEYTSWPRDASGSLNARFGLPVMPDIENISFDEEVKEAVEALKKKEEKAEPVNPFVTNVKGLEGLEKEIISSNSTCVLFLSAAYCRTCKILNPQYTRMARINEEEESDEENKIIFAKAETGSKIGKALGKSLEVNAVPSFVLFRDGKRYGSPLSISRIPSKKLNKAIEYLSSGMEWDDKLFRSLKS